MCLFTEPYLTEKITEVNILENIPKHVIFMDHLIPL